MKRYLLYIVLTVVLSTAGCTRGQWLDEVVAQRDEQEDVVPILRASQAKGLTVDSAEEIERTNKYYTVDTANGYYNEFKRYRLVFSDQTTVEFDVLGLFNGVQREYYAERGLDHIGYIDLVDVLGNLVIDIVQSDDMIVSLSFQYTSAIDDPNDNPNDNITYEIYYTSTDGQVVTPNDTTAFGANIVSNTYENGQGVITFDGNVTKIGYNAFYYCSSLASITIPEGVTSIGEYAFADCSNLASITIPDSVTSIGLAAFRECSRLVSITIPDGVTSIRDSAFYHCTSLTSITIPDGVTSIGEWAFSGCSSLASITIPDGVTSIGHSAFWGCSSLTSITIPDSVTSIGYRAFDNCSSLAEVYCKAITPPTATPNSSSRWGAFDSNASDRTIYVPEESVEAYKTAEWWSEYADAFVPYDFLKNRKIYYTSTDGNVVTPNHSGTFYFGANIVSNTYADGQGVITFDGEVTTIGYFAFYYCSSLASITIPDSVTSIGHMAFGYCSSLASITIPDSVTSIGEQPFSGCSSLAEFSGKFASEDGRCLIADGVLHFFTPAAGLTEYVIPNGVTTIGIRAFFECDELVSVTIPDGVTSIKDDAFRWCDNLASINIPEGVTEIGDYAFGLTKLKSVTLPESLTSLGYIAFAYCYGLKEVYCKATTPPTAIPDSSSKWGAFNYNASDRKIYVPEESVEAYKTAEWWSEYADAIVGYKF